MCNTLYRIEYIVDVYAGFIQLQPHRDIAAPARPTSSASTILLHYSWTNS